MANICSFGMKVNGKKENVKRFYDALIQEGDIWMGRGASAYVSDEVDEEEYSLVLSGTCKGSVQSALIDDALSMRKTPEKWNFTPYEVEGLSFITLLEATEKWDLTMEVYSEEPSNGFQEHFIFQNGNILEEEWVEYFEEYIGAFDSKAEAEASLGVKISDEQWEDQHYVSGGYGDWFFDI